MQKSDQIQILLMNEEKFEKDGVLTLSEEAIIRVLNHYKMPLSINEIIRKLKRDGSDFTKKNTIESLHALSKKNIIIVNELCGNSYWLLKSRL